MKVDICKLRYGRGWVTEEQCECKFCVVPFTLCKPNIDVIADIAVLNRFTTTQSTTKKKEKNNTLQFLIVPIQLDTYFSPTECEPD